MTEQIETWDRDLFLLLNGKHNVFCDHLMYWISAKITWIPLYALLLYFIYRKTGLKGTVFSLVAVAFLVTLTDMLSVQAFKEVIQRYRPCHNLEIGHLVHTVRSH